MASVFVIKCPSPVLNRPSECFNLVRIVTVIKNNEIQFSDQQQQWTSLTVQNVQVQLLLMSGVIDLVDRSCSPVSWFALNKLHS